MGGVGASARPGVTTFGPRPPVVWRSRRVWLEGLFPALKTQWYFVSSPEAEWYNCVLWACGNDREWCEAAAVETTGYFWPEGVPTDGSVHAYQTLFARRGYAICEDGALEPGVEKVALYVHPAFGFRHVAWQCEDGRWWSKVGESFDIQHATLDALEHDGPKGYGKASVIMKRPRKHREDSLHEAQG